MQYHCSKLQFFDALQKLFRMGRLTALCRLFRLGEEVEECSRIRFDPPVGIQRYIAVSQILSEDDSVQRVLFSFICFAPPKIHMPLGEAA